MKKALIVCSLLFVCTLACQTHVARAQDAVSVPQPSVPATDQGPVVQITGEAGNGCPAGSSPSGGECYSCPSGDTLSGTLCDPPSGSNAPVSAQQTSQTSGSGSGFVPLAPIPGLTQGVVANSSGLVTFLQNLYKYLIGVAVVLAIVMIIWGGIEIAARDSVSKQSAGRERITQAILGLVLVLAPVLVFTIINPAILNLSVSLPPLNTQWGSGGSQNSGGALNQAPNNNPGSGTPSANGCNAPTGGGEYSTVSCGTNEAAQNWLSQNCATYGTLAGGECQQLNSQQQCAEGSYAQVSCPSASPRTFTFVDEDSNNSIFNLSNQRLHPIDSDMSTVQGFISGCSQNVCFVGGAVQSAGTCAPGSYSFNTSGGTAPKCFSATLLCYNPSKDSRLCDQSFQVDAAP